MINMQDMQTDFNLQANYGINYSNEYLQDHWKIRQMEASLNIKSNNDCKNSTTEIHKQITILKTDNKNDIDCKDIEDKENILKECGLHKNAVIRSLLKSHIISLNDLQIPNNCKNIKIKNTNLQVCIKNHSTFYIFTTNIIINLYLHT